MNNREVQEYYSIPLTREERALSLEELEAKYGKGKINAFPKVIDNGLVYIPTTRVSDQRRPEEHINWERASNRFLEHFDDETRLVAFTLMSSDFTADEVRGAGVVSEEREDAYEEWINSFSGLNGREGIGKKATPIGEGYDEHGAPILPTYIDEGFDKFHGLHAIKKKEEEEKMGNIENVGHFVTDEKMMQDWDRFPLGEWTDYSVNKDEYPKMYNKHMMKFSILRVKDAELADIYMMKMYIPNDPEAADDAVENEENYKGGYDLRDTVYTVKAVKKED